MAKQVIQAAQPTWGFWKVVFAGVFIVVLSAVILTTMGAGATVALIDMGNSLQNMFNSASQVK